MKGTATRLPSTRVAAWRRLAIGTLLATLPCSCGPPDPWAPAPGQHVILISLDTLRADHLHCYGYQRATSPNLDALAASGALFERARSHSNNTAPSHMTMFTGVLPAVHGTTHAAGVQPAADLPLLAERMANAGYRTAAFADGGYVLPAFGFARGFETFSSRLEHVDDKLDRVERWLQAADNRPTFLFLHTYTVHAPYVPDARFDVFSDPAYDGPLAARVEGLLPHMGRGLRADVLEPAMDVFWHRRKDFDETDIRHLVDLYDACILQADAAVGRLLAALEAKGWLDNAWVIVTSDHGEAFREHSTFSHRQLYEEEIHVPLIVRPPGGLTAPVRVATPVGLADLTPTVLDMVGLPPAELFQGSSLLPPSALHARIIHAAAGPELTLRSIVDGSHKTIISALGVRHYDLALDPSELHDLGATHDATSSADTANTVDTADPADAINTAGAALDAGPTWAPAMLEADVTNAARNASLRNILGEPRPAATPDAAQADALRALGYVR